VNKINQHKVFRAKAFRPSRVIALAMVLLYMPFLSAGQVQHLKISPTSDYTRLVIDLSEPVTHHLMTLAGPDRVVIDLHKTDMAGGIRLPSGSGVVARLRSGTQDGRLRLVADLKSNVRAQSYLVRADKRVGGPKKDRLIIDLHHQSEQGEVVAPTKVLQHTTKELVVAIDAGHGGIDPGSIGKHGTQEKHVVMQIAKRLASKINQAEGMRAYMVRDSDHKVQYYERMNRARKKDADLFVSIHADSYHDATVSGSSVYVLSQRGASSAAARWLANKVNASDSDLVGGVTLDDKDDTLASVLLDLSQNATIAASTSLGKSVLNELAAIGRIRKRSVQYANFAVLKSPDIPSILVETAYISNPDEERKLKSAKHQERIAKALFGGVKKYFQNNPPANSLFAQKRGVKGGAPKLRTAEVAVPAKVTPQPVSKSVSESASKPRPKREVKSKKQALVAKVSAPKAKATKLLEYKTIKHTIRSGETLSGVSIRYNVTIKAIKSINGLKREQLRIGQVLRIPVI